MQPWNSCPKSASCLYKMKHDTHEDNYIPRKMLINKDKFTLLEHKNRSVSSTADY